MNARWTARTTFFFAVGLTSIAGATPEAHRPGYGVPAEQIARFEALRSKEQLPRRSRTEVMPDPSARRQVMVADLVRYEDGVVVIARHLGKKSTERLRRLGVPVVTRFEDLRDNVILDERLYRVLPVSPPRKDCFHCPEGHLAGPDSVLLTRRVGQRIQLELTRNSAGRFVVTNVKSVDE